MRKNILKEEAYAGVSNKTDYIAAGKKADPAIQRLVGGNGTPSDILAFVKSQAKSSFIGDGESKLMMDSVVAATKKCLAGNLTAETYSWCQIGRAHV